MASTLTQALRSRPKPLPVAPVGPQPTPRTYLPPIRKQPDLNAIAPYVPTPRVPPPKGLPRQVRLPNQNPFGPPPPPNLYGDMLNAYGQTPRMMRSNSYLPLQYMLPQVQSMDPGMIARYQVRPQPFNSLNYWNWGNAVGGWPQELPPTLRGQTPYGIQNAHGLPYPYTSGV